MLLSDLPVKDHQRLLTRGRVILWWELRRLVYNAVLLVIGGATVAGYALLMTKLIPLATTPSNRWC